MGRSSHYHAGGTNPFLQTNSPLTSDSHFVIPTALGSTLQGFLQRPAPNRLLCLGLLKKSDFWQMLAEPTICIYSTLKTDAQTHLNSISKKFKNFSWWCSANSISAVLVAMLQITINQPTKSAVCSITQSQLLVMYSPAACQSCHDVDIIESK